MIILWQQLSRIVGKFSNKEPFPKTDDGGLCLLGLGAHTALGMLHAGGAWAPQVLREDQL